MPAELDRCVEEVKQDLIKKGYTLEEAEEAAWGICRDKLGYRQKHNCNGCNCKKNKSK